ncbi:unnamed protein product [Owenia fusiformis]|uniref:Ribonuclease P/MRP protein subunit POP5 n=1 Tax=Owenia fusiformis TaxID=6347 RepID=A0A8S4Q5U2_OWEFU|nr:unnamed protein product [Owenia fusiformis]
MVRLKNRYLLCEIMFPLEDKRLVHDINVKTLRYQIGQAIQTLHGTYGRGLLQQSLKVNYINTYTNTVLIRGKRGAHKLLWSAITTIKKIGNFDCFFRLIHLGGTIRSCQKSLIQHNKKRLAQILPSIHNEGEKLQIRQSIMNSTQKLEKPHEQDYMFIKNKQNIDAISTDSDELESD